MRAELLARPLKGRDAARLTRSWIEGVPRAYLRWWPQACLEDQGHQWAVNQWPRAQRPGVVHMLAGVAASVAVQRDGNRSGYRRGSGSRRSGPRVAQPLVHWPSKATELKMERGAWGETGRRGFDEGWQEGVESQFQQVRTVVKLSSATEQGAHVLGTAPSRAQPCGCGVQ